MSDLYSSFFTLMNAALDDVAPKNAALKPSEEEIRLYALLKNESKAHSDLLAIIPADRAQQNQDASSSSSSTNSILTRTSSDSSDVQASIITQDGKIKIDEVRENLVCPSCQEVFTTELRYRKHMGALDCQKTFGCRDCGRKFQKEKDLRRHRGPDETSSACLQSRGGGHKAKPFACTCNSKAYTRKDSLLRHLRDYVNEKPQLHRCKACDNSPCSCITSKPT